MDTLDTKAPREGAEIVPGGTVSQFQYSVVGIGDTEVEVAVGNPELSRVLTFMRGVDRKR